MSRAGIAVRLRSYGFEVMESEILTPLVPAVAMLKEADPDHDPVGTGGALADLRI
jgi:hypothetical protein